MESFYILSKYYVVELHLLDHFHKAFKYVVYTYRIEKF